MHKTINHMVSRRNFIKAAGATAAGLAISSLEGPEALASTAESYSRIPGANSKVNVALVGIGFRGEQNAVSFDKTGLMNVVALCDVDMGAKHTQKIMDRFPKAKRYKDFRKMFDEMRGQIDAVVVSTPDCAHFAICMRAIREGISVYSEKPLGQTFLQNELLIKAAKQHPEVVTQMGNQGHSEANYFQFKAWMDAGIIKDVYAVTAHMNNDRRWHKYDPNIKKFPDAQPLPETIDWDLWLMDRQWHDFSDKFHYGNWRCWYDFGMGALGDWGAHIIDTCHEFLDLGLPYEIELLKATYHNDYFFPMSSTIKFRFPRRGDMPACDITWYDGVDNVPEVPKGYKFKGVAADIPTVNGGKLKPSKLTPGKEIYTNTYIFQGGSHASTLNIIPEELEKQLAAEGKLPEVPQTTSNHYANFLLAVLGKEKARSPFEKAGVLSEVFNLGVIAQRLGHGFKFDRNAKEVIGDPFATAMLSGMPPRKGWEEYYQI